MNPSDLRSRHHVAHPDGSGHPKAGPIQELQELLAEDPCGESFLQIPK